MARDVVLGRQIAIAARVVDLVVPRRALTVVAFLAAVIVASVGARARAKQDAACVPAPELSFTTRITRWPASGRTQVDHRFATLRAWDLDGDGRADALVPRPRERAPEGTCPGEVRWDVYATRGTACDVLLGTVEGDAPHAEAVRPGHHGLRDLVTTIAPATGAEGATRIRYEHDGTRYVEVSRTRGPARCDVHPDACRDVPHATCDLRDHPSVPGRFDADGTVLAMLRASEAAQVACRAPAATIERCDVHVSFANDGRVTAVDVRDCPRRRACVAPFFQALRTSPFVGDPAFPSTSFQIPAP
ncbi:hypothetical protein [Sandaracinus amylolyticus]|uniref:Uncharacterized protein n=1 Tax=Sandaracinus amylolyticus TaxID=927083 RepID=A0A0F6SGN3_9BACT|nr:hypothetical protein [Sandaracinus amylolyticus]AKF08994.1 hypothetical protein DB32_006143 [Sandaracinus amylolyticus]